MAAVRRRPLARWRAASADTPASRAFTAGLGGGLFYYAFNFAAAFLLLRDLAPGAPARLVLSFLIIPLLGNLPIAFSGLGLREHISATLFNGIGAGAATGPAFSLLLFTVSTLLPGLLGLALAATPWAGSGSRRRPTVGRPMNAARGPDYRVFPRPAMGQTASTRPSRTP